MRSLMCHAAALPLNGAHAASCCADGMLLSAAAVSQLNLSLLVRVDGLVRKCCEVLEQRIWGLLMTEVAAVRYARHVHGTAFRRPRGAKVCSNRSGLPKTRQHFASALNQSCQT